MDVANRWPAKAYVRNWVEARGYQAGSDDKRRKLQTLQRPTEVGFGFCSACRRFPNQADASNG